MTATFTHYTRAFGLGLAAVASLAIAQPAYADSVLGGVLGKASDAALDKLSLPGGFYNDTAVRIALPGLGGKTGSAALKMTDKLGLTDKLTRSMNDAAGVAAKEAKPIFRDAINNFSVADAPGVIGATDGGTQYLKKSAGAALRDKLRPLIVGALGKSGAFGQLAKVGKLSKLGSLLGTNVLSQDGLTDSVTDQAMNGIFTYMGREEANLRQNPLGAGKALLNSVLKK